MRSCLVKNTRERLCTYRLTDILDVILLLARGNSRLGEAEYQFSNARTYQKRGEEERTEYKISLFIFDELLRATYPNKIFIGKENAYVCI